MFRGKNRLNSWLNDVHHPYHMGPEDLSNKKKSKNSGLGNLSEFVTPFFSLFLMRKPLSNGQKWFLRSNFSLIGGKFVFKSGLRFSILFTFYRCLFLTLTLDWYWYFRAHVLPKHLIEEVPTSRKTTENAVFFLLFFLRIFNSISPLKWCKPCMFRDVRNYIWFCLVPHWIKASCV